MYNDKLHKINITVRKSKTREAEEIFFNIIKLFLLFLYYLLHNYSALTLQTTIIP